MISWKKDEESRSRVYKFWRSYRKVRYVEALEGVRQARAYRLW